MMNRIGMAGVVVLVAVGVAGCGGAGGGNGLFTLKATSKCLTKAGYQVTTETNPYLPGSGGNLRVQLSKIDHLLNPSTPTGSAPNDEFVFLVFAKDPAAALVTENKAVTLAVQSFEHQAVLLTRAGARAGVGLSKNVFFYSANGALTQGERTKVSSCLH